MTQPLPLMLLAALPWLLGAALAAPDPRGSWSAAPPMLQARAAHAVVADEQALYALAGTGAGGRPVLELERFDGRQWQALGRLPGQGLNAPAAVLLQGQIYLIGGFGSSSNLPSGEVLRYDIKTGRWSEAPPLPAPRGGHAAAVLDGRIHVIGGGNSERTLALHTRFDPATQRWQDLAPLPRAEGSPAIAVLGGRLYAIGGRSGFDDFGEVYVYDPAVDRWSKGPPIPPRGTAGALSHCGGLLLFGGESQQLKASLGDVLRLGPGQDSWVALNPMPTPRNFARAVALRGAIYVVGGSPVPGSSHASAGSTVVERFELPCPP